MTVAGSNLNDAQRDRLKRFRCTESVDIHCHCLPGLDDGPQDVEAALELCSALAADGITAVIATPHQLGRYHDQNRADDIRQSVRALREALGQAGIPLTVQAGADVRIDERLATLLDEDQVLTLADGGRYMLLELPHDTFVQPRPLIEMLRARSCTAVISHPERNQFVCQKIDLVHSWLESGAILQITAGSVVGDFGPPAQSAAWHLLRRGWVDLVASDAHDATRRPPRMSAAIDAIASQLGHAVARRICIENPGRVLSGMDVKASPRAAARREEREKWPARVFAGLKDVIRGRSGDPVPPFSGRTLSESAAVPLASPRSRP